MNIRNVNNRELPILLEMNQSAVPHVSRVELSDMEWYLENAALFLLIESSGEPAGFVIVLQPGLDYDSLNYTFFCSNYSDFDYVDRIVISEKFRGKKLGTSLYKELFKKSKAKYITCEVNLKPPNMVSMKFHLALGFKQVAELHTQSGKKSVAMMVKKL